jgi:hypothetical protein
MDRVKLLIWRAKFWARHLFWPIIEEWYEHRALKRAQERRERDG